MLWKKNWSFYDYNIGVHEIQGKLSVEFLESVNSFSLLVSFTADKKCWIWTTKLNGVAKFRICFTELVSVMQISLETNVLMYLNCSTEQQKICPIMERMADKNDSHENKIKPLFCLAVQFPYSHDEVYNSKFLNTIIIIIIMVDFIMLTNG